MRSEHGFSLIEVLVSLFILSTISVAGTTIIMRSFQSRDALETSMTRVQTLAEVHSRVRDDLFQWVPRASESRPGLDPNAIFLGGGIGDSGLLFAFVRDGWTNPGLSENRSGLFSIRYIFESGQLIRQTRRYADPSYTDDFENEVLMEGLTDAYAEFRQGIQWAPQWRATPDTPLGAPPAVKLTLQDANGSTLEWLFLLPPGGAL